MGGNELLQMFVPYMLTKCKGRYIHFPRHMLWSKLYNIAHEDTRQPIQAMSVMHKAVVSEPKSAHLRRRFIGGYQPRYWDREGR